MAQLPLDAPTPGTYPEELSKPLAPLLPQKAADPPPAPSVAEDINAPVPQAAAEAPTYGSSRYGSMAPVAAPVAPASTQHYLLQPDGKVKILDPGTSAANPPPGATVRIPLSDGSYIFAPKMSEPQLTQAQANMEAYLAQEGQKRAKAQGAPVITPGHVYTESQIYPNTQEGRAFGSGDYLGRAGSFPGVGNALNPLVDKYINRSRILPFGLTDVTWGDAGESAARAATYRGSYLWDLPAGIYTAGKHAFDPQSGTRGDPPLLAPEMQRRFGVQPPPADQSWMPRLLESGWAGGRGSFFNPMATVRGATRAGIGELTSKVGETVAGAAGDQYKELGSQAGSLAGSGLPLGPLISRIAARTVRAPDARETFAAGAQDRPAPSPVEGATTEANARSLMNPTGQRIANWMSSVPYFGDAIRRANEAALEWIRGQKNVAAQTQAGPGGLSAEPGTEAIGAPLTEGARLLHEQLQARKNARYEPVNAAMGPGPGQPFGQNVDVAPVASALNERLAGNQVPPPTEAALRNMAHEQLFSAAPGGENYAQERGPVPALPQPTLDVPWPLTSSFVSHAVAGLPPSGPLRASQVREANIVRDVLNAQEAAANRVNPALGQQFRAARTGYKTDTALQERLYPASGVPSFDDQGNRIFSPVGGADAAKIITGNLQRSDRMEPFARALDPNYWGRASGNFINTWGEDPSGQFKPRKFAEMTSPQSISGPSMSLLTQAPGGQGLTDAYRRIQNARQVAQNWDVPPTPSGLVHASGTGAAVLAALEHFRTGARHLLGDKWGPLAEMAPAAAIGGMSRGIESPTFKRALAGHSMVPEFVRSLYQGIPAASAVDEQQRLRLLRSSPAGRAAGIVPPQPGQ